jgi:hypothetical protein
MFYKYKNPSPHIKEEYKIIFIVYIIECLRVQIIFVGYKTLKNKRF